MSGNKSRRSVSVPCKTPGAPAAPGGLPSPPRVLPSSQVKRTMLTRKKSVENMEMAPAVIDLITFYVQQILRLGRKEHATLEVDVESHKVKIVKARGEDKKKGAESEKVYQCSAFTKFERSGESTLSVTLSDGTHSGKGTVKKFSFVNSYQREEFVALVEDSNCNIANFLRSRLSLDGHSENGSGMSGDFGGNRISGDFTYAGELTGYTTKIERAFLTNMLRFTRAKTLGECARSESRRHSADDEEHHALYKPLRGELTCLTCPHTTLVLYRARVEKRLRSKSFVAPKSIPVRGEIILTQHRLIFNAYETMEKHDLHFPLTSIVGIKRKSTTLYLTLKHSAFAPQFILSDLKVMEKFEAELEERAFLKKPASPTSYFAFQYKAACSALTDCEEEEDKPIIASGPLKENGYYDCLKDYERIGMVGAPGESTIEASQLTFRVVDNCNSSWAFKSYPAKFIVPVALTDKMLEEVATYRSKQRVPAVTWVHLETKGMIVRCAQPMRGFKDSRCSSDEAYFTLLREMSGETSTIVILDARAEVAATANRGMGKGTENLQHYQCAERLFCNIGNIHVMRDSLNKLQELCEPTSSVAGCDNWWSAVEATGWLKHLGLVMLAANDAVFAVENGNCTVVHCSDGWDRTAQICSLAEMMLDPYYRTLEGFGALVEKHWCSFGHKFHDRIGHGDSDPNCVEHSPIFLQFLDIVWQCKRQLPTAFEFNNAFLMTIADEHISCKYGNFLYNTECERVAHNVFSDTVSVWADIIKESKSFTDKDYVRDEAVKYLEISSRNVKLWEEFYCRRSKS
jgi:hypothetical protein